MTKREPLAPGQTGESLSQADQVLETLADYRRRYLLHYLKRYDRCAEFSEIVDYLIETLPEIETEDRESVTIDLHHYHLPKLSELGFIDYNDDSGTVEYRHNALLDEWLDRLIGTELE